MRTPRIFVEEPPTELHQTFDIAESTAHYLVHVLRLKVGDAVTLFHQNYEYDGHIASIHKKKTALFIEKKTYISRESPIVTHLALGYSKGDKMDIAFQKAVELGVHAITPIFSEFCSVKRDRAMDEKKMLHWKKILISSAEQCERNTIPELHPITTFSHFIAENACDLKWILHPPNRNESALLDTSSPLPSSPASVCVLVGPEGGFSEKEVSDAMAAQFQKISLGPRILRTETAPLVILSIIQQRWGDYSFCV
jgi:16S rRNA (uracil1498-N3)-methyltransferase